MGIVDELLAEFELPSYGRCRVEADVNGGVHLHLGSVRVELSQREFAQFADVVEAAGTRLRETKRLETTDRPSGQEGRVLDAL